MARLTGYPSLRGVIDGTEPSDPLTTVTRGDSGDVTVGLTDEDVALTITVLAGASEAVIGADAPTPGLVRVPEGIVRRVNTLLRDQGVTLLPDWRSGTHTLREASSKRTRLVSGEAVTVSLRAVPGASAGDPTLTPERPTVTPTAGLPTGTLGGLTERGAFSGDLFVTDEVAAVWADADWAHAHGLPSALFLQGPPGTGKTHMAKGLSAREGRTVIEHQCFGMNEPTDWFGQVGFAHGATTFTPTPLYWALTMPGPRTLILDEVNRASSAAMNALLPLLAGEPTLTMPHDGHPIVVAPDLKIVLTANIGSTYSGTSQIDPALMDRKTFAVEVPYLSPEQEQSLLTGRMALHGLTLEAWQAATLVAFANEVRAASTSGDVTPVSARQMLAAASSATRPENSLLDAVRRTVLVDYSREGGEASEYTAIAVIAAGIDWSDPANRPESGPDVFDGPHVISGSVVGPDEWCRISGRHSHVATTFSDGSGTLVEAVRP